MERTCDPCFKLALKNYTAIKVATSRIGIEPYCDDYYDDDCGLKTGLIIIIRTGIIARSWSDRSKASAKRRRSRGILRSRCCISPLLPFFLFCILFFGKCPIWERHPSL